ncbi:MAG: aspartate/glutamate racemase family protein, partial [Candidatus Baltobacteraceae bacterium]
QANVSYLVERGAEAIVMGCNTSCAIAARFGWPTLGVPILDLIGGAAEAVARLDAPRIGVLATSATARSGAYGAAIRERDPRVTVIEAAAPALVPLVESGTLRGPLARSAVAGACEPFGGGIDAIVLACTHFPMLDPVFADVLGERVVRVDPAEMQARRAVALVRERVGGAGYGRGRTTYVTNGPLERFAANVAKLMGDLDDVEQVEEQRHGQRSQDGTGDDLRDRVGFEIHS